MNSIFSFVVAIFAFSVSLMGDFAAFLEPDHFFRVFYRIGHGCGCCWWWWKVESSWIKSLGSVLKRKLEKWGFLPSWHFYICIQLFTITTNI